ncbi:MAG TPA: 5'/3'-nucleotidase SurE [Clostridia bacterium]|nr:5'/3'-nucleotidase SurE [Clostridia bacterium]
MRILLTNDDGISAFGLHALIAALYKEHELYIAAPDSQRSAVASAMTLSPPLRAVPWIDPAAHGAAAYAISGTPVDCVRLAIGNLFDMPELVISGINNGHNLGTDTLYSGTVAAAREAAVRYGLPAIAISLGGCANMPTAAFAAKLAMRALFENPLPKGLFLNVNAPDLHLSKVKGVRLATLGRVDYDSPYAVISDADGRLCYHTPRESSRSGGQDSDVMLNEAGYISFTTMGLSGESGINHNIDDALLNGLWEAR